MYHGKYRSWYQKKMVPVPENSRSLYISISSCTFRSRCVLIVSVVSVDEQIIVGPDGVPDPPFLAQMTFTQCPSMPELIFDSGAWWPNLAICVIFGTFWESHIYIQLASSTVILNYLFLNLGFGAEPREIKGFLHPSMRGAPNKKNFFLGDFSQICLPTHPPQVFCEIWEN